MIEKKYFKYLLNLNIVKLNNPSIYNAYAFS